ncbi:MAG: Na+/H+ antiporter subunit E [Hyphomicrobiales bacterium]|nr:Na+/H+ antiporter subunit E [Hyphomicrobiales bacterium]
MLRHAGLVTVLFAFWLLLSGHYTTFLIAVGLATSVAVTVGLHSMKVVDEQAQPFELLAGAVTYWPWLAWEVLKSGLRVTRIVLDPSLPISPAMRQVRSSQKTVVGRATFANSITLTPGTISVALEGDKILVHALEAGSLDDLDEGTMDRRVVQFEGGK